MINRKKANPDMSHRDPVEVLAELAADQYALDGVLERVMPASDESWVTELAYLALCESHGVPDSASAKFAWFLYGSDALDGLDFDYYLNGAVAAFAWPDYKVAVMLVTSSEKFDQLELPSNEILNWLYSDEVRDSAFQENGWLVVRVDPDSPALKQQASRIAGLLRAMRSECAS